MPIPFNARLLAAVEQKKSCLCLGLDLDPDRSSRLHGSNLESLRAASLAIVEATWNQVWGYKLNFAFFERYGSVGYAWLETLVAAIAGRALVVGDGKRGDIGNSARHYARAMFGQLGLDAATVNPYMGRDAVEPFLADTTRGAFVLCLSSNPGAADFQQRGNGSPLYLAVARWAQGMNHSRNLGLVVGATHTEELAEVRQAAPALPFLIPGIGAQEGSLKAAVASGTEKAPSIIAIARAILYAGDGSLDAITAAVADYNRRINNLVASGGA